MPTKTGRARDLYLELIRRFPLKSIKSHKALKEALSLINDLIDKPHLGNGERMYLDALGTLAASYERNRYPIPKADPVAVLEFLMEQHDKSQTDIVRDCGIDKTTMSLLLSGRRELSKLHIRKLADYFHVSTDVFM
jgi:HTH-type transcriptional regulator/antitoxin HigA